MDILVPLAATMFLVQLSFLYLAVVRNWPNVALLAGVLLAVFWAALAVTEYFEVEPASPLLLLSLVVLLPLSFVGARRTYGAVSNRAS